MIRYSFAICTAIVFLCTSISKTFAASEEAAREKMLHLFAGEWVSKGIYISAKLGIADHLLKGPKSTKELAELTSCHEPSLARLLHMLAGFNVFEETDNNVFANTELSKLLSKESESSLHSLCVFYGEDMHQAWESLLPSIQSGKTAFELEFNKPVFAFFKENPSRAQLFQSAMKEKSKAVIQSVVSSYDFSKIKTVYDIGGGYGQLAFALSKRYPTLSAINFELKDVVAKAQKILPQVTSVKGDFFEKVPTGGDAYVLKSVIHDWDDEKAETILKNCHNAMQKESKLLIVDVVLQPKDLTVYANCMDILMLAVTGGKERSLNEFQKLLDKTGFVLENVYSTKTEFSILEAKKKPL